MLLDEGALANVSRICEPLRWPGFPLGGAHAAVLRWLGVWRRGRGPYSELSRAIRRKPSVRRLRRSRWSSIGGRHAASDVRRARGLMNGNRPPKTASALSSAASCRSGASARSARPDPLRRLWCRATV